MKPSDLNRMFCGPMKTVVDGEAGIREYEVTLEWGRDGPQIVITPNNTRSGAMGPHYCGIPWLEEVADQDPVYEVALQWYYRLLAYPYGPVLRVSAWEDILG